MWKLRLYILTLVFTEESKDEQKKSEKAEPKMQIELKKKQYIEIKPSGVY